MKNLCSTAAERQRKLRFFPELNYKVSRRLDPKIVVSWIPGSRLVNLEWEMSRSLCSKILNTQILLTLLGPSDVVHSSSLKTSIPPLLEDNAETSAFQDNMCPSQDLSQPPLWASSNWRIQEFMRNHHAKPRQYHMVMIQAVLLHRNLWPFTQLTIHWKKRILRNFKVVFIIQEPKVIQDTMSE